MVVKIVRVHMGAHQNFVAVTPQATRRFKPDLMGFLRGNLARSEALVTVLCHVPSHLAESFLRLRHPFVCLLLGTV